MADNNTAALPGWEERYEEFMLSWGLGSAYKRMLVGATLGTLIVWSTQPRAMFHNGRPRPFYPLASQSAAADTAAPLRPGMRAAAAAAAAAAATVPPTNTPWWLAALAGALLGLY